LREHKELAELEAGDDSPAPEGCGRSGDKELARFLSIAAGSTSELDYQLLLARDLGHLPSDAHAHLAEEISEVRRMLYRFIQSLNAEPG